ncbi:MAG: hypothetical protein IJ610_04085 [Bacteroidaceae bacterium]|nr:hypothetical protein [Bacteroidaceae bacterium]
MKRIYLLIATGLFCTASMQAQTVVAELGFEDDTQKEAFKTEYALTPELGTYGDWVNYKDTDEWTEKSTDDPHSGEYCFMAANTGAVGMSWDRGFKMSFPMKLETPYRVSFWVKADPTYEGTDADGNPTEEATKLTSWLSKGMENYDKSILSYGLNQATGPNAQTPFNGEWQHMSYVVYNPTAEAMDATIPSWQGTGEYPARFGGQAGETYRSHFNEKLPEVYFFIANMFCPVTYYLDDIKIEEGVTVKEVTYSDEIIKIDFGYATNIANLAKQNKGTFSLDTDLVKVTVDGEETDVLYLEGKEDGFLYILVDAMLDEESDVVVSFDGADDLLYASADRPSSDTQGQVKVFGFKNEKGYWDELVDTEFAAWGQPTVRSSVPVNKSFNLKPEDVKEVSMTFTTAVSTKKAKATLKKGTKKTDLTADIKLSEDGKTVTAPVSGLTDGEYEFIIEGLMNAEESVTAEDAIITFEIGEPQGDAEEVVAYQSDFTPYGQDALPVGYSGASDNGERQSTAAEPYTGGGAPRIMGATDHVNHGIYWGARGGTQGLLQFGKYAAESANGDQLADGIDASEALYLDEGAYLLTFRNGAWEDHSQPYAVRVCKPGDETPEVIFEETGIVPDSKILHEGVNITTDAAISPIEYEFAVTEPGYYYVEFEGNWGWQCWILTSLSVTSKPASSGAAAMKKLKDAIETAQMNLDGADEKYDGTAKTALAETIKKAKEGTFTNPMEVDDMLKELAVASQKLADRKANYDNFVKKLADAQTSIETLEGKYKTNEKVQDAEAIIKKYDGVDPKNFSDEELAAASKDVDGVPGILNNIKSIVDILTFRAIQASDLALKLGVEDEVIDALDALASDATADIEAANKQITLALYQAIVDGMDLEPLKEKQYSSQVDEEGFDETDPESVATHDADGHKLLLSGIKASGYIRNPNFYTTNTDANTVDFTGWTFEPLEYETTNDEGETETHTGSAKMTGAASADNPVVTASLNPYGQSAEYKFYQVVENIPAGVYTININTRTASKNNPDADGNYGFFNAQDENGVWDKYIFAQVDDEAPIMVPFTVGAYNTNGFPTYITDIKIKDGQKLTIGAVEHLVSGKASTHTWNDELGAYEPAAFWDTNTWVRDAVLYFTAPLDDYNYAAAAEALKSDIATAIETVEAAPAKDNALYNVAGQKVNASYKGIVIKNGKKYLLK